MLLFFNRIKTSAANLGVPTVGEFTVFAPFPGLSWNSFVLDWTAADGASAYDVYVNGVLIHANTTLLYGGYYAATPLTDYAVTVTAKGAGYLPRSVHYTVTTLAKPKLAAPALINITGTEMVLAFDISLNVVELPFVSHLLVYVDGVLKQTIPAPGAVVPVSITGLTAGLRNVQVFAFSNSVGWDNSEVGEADVELVTGFKLATPVVEAITTALTSLSLTVMVVANATVYDFYLDNVLSQSSAVRVFAPTGLTAGQAYELKVIARRTIGPVYADSDPLVAFATTVELDGLQVESAGLKAIYEPFYGNITITPLPGENKCLITYTGVGNPFQPTWVADNIEFCGLRCHRNPAVNPPTSAINGNYYPNTTSSRYSFVTDYIDGKNVKVARTKSTNTEVPFNGGNIASPVAVTNAFGYFFFNNRTAIKALLESTSRVENLLFKSDAVAAKTYVIKGGSWASPGADFLDVVLKSDRLHAIKPRIKISWEDCNFLYETGLPNAWVVNSYLTTFSYPPIIRVAERATPYSIVFDSVDIIPSAYTVPGAEFNMSHLRVAMFTCLGKDFAGLFKVKNSNCWAERHEVEAKVLALEIPALPTGGLSEPSWLLPMFAESAEAGLITGDVNAPETDIAHYAEFVLENSNWEAPQVHGIKAGGWEPPPSSKWVKTGGVFRAIGLDADHPCHAYSSHNGAIRSLWEGVPLAFAKGTSGNFTSFVVQSGVFSWFQIWNGYNVGGRSSATDVYRDKGKEHFLEIQNSLGELFHIQLCSKDALPSGYTFPTVSGSEWASFEAIPVGQGHAEPPSSFSAHSKVSNTVFNIKGWSLTARNNRPLYVVSGSTQSDGPISVINTAGDILVHNGVEYEILEKTRRTITEAGKVIPVWRITLSAGISDAAPNFNVKTSRLQFALDGTARPATIKSDGVAGYFSYASTESNVQLKDCVIKGDFRATGKSMTGAGTTPLHVLPFIKEYTRCFFHSAQKSARMEQWNGVGLKMRGLRLSQDLKVIIDSGRMALRQTNMLGTGDPILLKNRPTFVFGTTSYGETKLVDVELSDENGMVLEDGGSFFFTNPAKTYNLRNIEVRAFHQIIEGEGAVNLPTSMRVWGKGILDISGMTAGKNRFNAPFDGNGFSVDYFMSLRISRQTGIFDDATAASCQLFIVGSGGEIGIDTRGFGVQSIFANNSLLLTDWLLKPIEGAFSGYAKGTGWPLISETHSNFSITAP